VNCKPPAKTRVIAIHYGDRGASPVDSDDGVNWNACNSGLPPNPGTMIRGATAQGMNIDPSTGNVYIVLKNEQRLRYNRAAIASRALKKNRYVQWHSGSFFHIG
jgi:hypothetical protein